MSEHSEEKEMEEEEKAVNITGEGVNAPKRTRPEVWERDENGAVHKERSLSTALYNLRTEYAAFLSIRTKAGWLHVELDQSDPENVYVTPTNVNTATRIHYTRAMRFGKTSHMTISNFKKMLKGLQGEKNEGHALRPGRLAIRLCRLGHCPAP